MPWLELLELSNGISSVTSITVTMLLIFMLDQSTLNLKASCQETSQIIFEPV
jgi:hypothetical protein